jgi:hypothetical protein
MQLQDPRISAPGVRYNFLTLKDNCFEVTPALIGRVFGYEPLQLKKPIILSETGPLAERLDFGKSTVSYYENLMQIDYLNCRNSELIARIAREDLAKLQQKGLSAADKILSFLKENPDCRQLMVNSSTGDTFQEVLPQLVNNSSQEALPELVDN